MPIQKTILAVNNFIVNTTMFLNNFSHDCEGKFMKISSRITDLETLLMIFEAKLNSFNIEESTDGKSSADPGLISGTETAGDLSSTLGYDDRDGMEFVGDKVGENVPCARAVDAGYTGDPDGHRSSQSSGDHGSDINKAPLRPPPPPPPPVSSATPLAASPLSAPILSPSIAQEEGSHETHHSSIVGENKNTDEREIGGGRIKAKEHPDYIGYFKMMKVTCLRYLFSVVRSVYQLSLPSLTKNITDKKRLV